MNTRYQTYPEYKESNIEWLDMLPKNWAGGSLRWFADIYSGGTPSKNVKEFWQDGDVPWLNSGAVNNPIVKEPSAYITLDALNNSSAKWIPPHALVMALAGQGKTKGTVAQLGFKTTCNQSMAAIVPNQQFSPRFLYWWLDSNYQNIRNMAGGDLRDGLNLELLGDIQCPIPESNEQTQIAAFLDRETAKIDQLIEKQQRLIKLLEEKRQAVISHAVTKGLNPDVSMKDSGVEWLGDVPEHWEMWKISHASEYIASGTTPKTDSDKYYDGDILWVTTSELRESVITKTKKHVTKQALVDMPTLRLHPTGSIAIAMYGATIGRLGILGNSATTNQACCVIPPSKILHNKFLFYWLLAMRREIINLSSGGGQPNVNQEKIASLKVSAPSYEEQTQIASDLDSEIAKFDKLRIEAKRMIYLLYERRTALISAAVTGKIDVRNHVSLDSNETTKI